MYKCLSCGAIDTIKGNGDGKICVNCGSIEHYTLIEEEENELTIFGVNYDGALNEDYDKEFEPCCKCDGHDACYDFGCAIEHGIIEDPDII